MDLSTHVPGGQGVPERRRVDRWLIGMEHPGASELAEDAHHAAGAMHVLHVDAGLGDRRGR